jgi:transposase
MEKDDEMHDTMIGVDLAKRVFQLHVASMTGEVKDRKKLTRDQFRRYMTEQPNCVVVFEACGSAHYWAREMNGLGHEAKIIPAQYVKPFVKRHKNDRNDAEAIVVAAQRPEMRFASVKAEEQQARAVVFRGRERLVHQRTELVNALRSVLYEYGHAFPVGFVHVKKIEALIEAPNCDLPALVIGECQDLLAQIAEKTERIKAKDKLIKELAKESEVTRRLQTMPGVGPMTALAVEAFAPDMAQFSCGRDFAAWLGLVPLQNSTGGKSRLGKMSKMGQVDIRRLLIIGAMSRIIGRARHRISDDSWLGRKLAARPKMLVGITLANKMARQIWAMLTKNEDYRDPALVGAA